MSAVRAGEEGAVELSYFIKTNGTVRSPKVTRSSGYADLDKAAVGCVLRFTYKPAIKNGRPVEVPWIIRVVFRLSDLRDQPYAIVQSSPKPLPPRKPPKKVKPDRPCVPIASLSNARAIL